MVFSLKLFSSIYIRNTNEDVNFLTEKQNMQVITRLKLDTIFQACSDASTNNMSAA